MQREVSISHSRIVQSVEDVARSRADGEKAHDVSADRWPRRTATTPPVGFHTTAVLSCEADARSFPSGEKQHCTTQPRWPVRGAIGSGSAPFT